MGISTLTNSETGRWSSRTTVSQRLEASFSMPPYQPKGEVHPVYASL